MNFDKFLDQPELTKASPLFMEASRAKPQARHTNKGTSVWSVSPHALSIKLSALAVVQRADKNVPIPEGGQGRALVLARKLWIAL